MMRKAVDAGSLAFRLFLSAVVVMAAVLVIVGLVLSSLYRGGTERAFDRRLDIYLKTIVAEVAGASGGSGLVMPSPQALGDPVFLFPLSGWYWQVTRLDEQVQQVRTSRSLADVTLPLLRRDAAGELLAGMREGYIVGPDGQVLRVVERGLDLGPEGRYIITVAGDAREIDSEISKFNLVMMGTFGVLGLALLLILLFQIRFGLKPLNRISAALSAVRSGRAERLEGEYPREIAPLVREVNALIDANKEIVERARTHVGNLAHALKTPLSVLLNEAGGREDPLAQRVRDQAGAMRDSVARHLERARLAARTTVPSTVCDVRPILVSLARTMEKIHHDKDLSIDIVQADDVRFRGERQDIEEMVGNLVDNACKWAHAHLEIRLIAELPRRSGDFGLMRVIIDDDGPGLSPAKRAEVGRRGSRLDESKPGSGLGLSIVQELATLYGGQLELGPAPMGGLRVQLILPAA